MADEIKMCKDCKWRGRAWFISDRNQYCYQPELIKNECLKYPGGNGKPFASIARNYGPCYREGKYWESRLKDWMEK